MMDEQTNLETIVEQALASTDEAYLEAESLLFESQVPSSAASGGTPNGDPIAVLMRHVATSPGPSPDEVKRASQYLDGAERWAARTIRGNPSPDGVVDNLSRLAGPRLAEWFALRLVQVRNMPDWRVRAALGYIERHPTSTVTGAVIRFAGATEVPAQQALAARVLRRISDPQLSSKMAAERTRLAALGRKLPPAVTELTA
jgi:hypothetical protein